MISMSLQTETDAASTAADRVTLSPVTPDAPLFQSFFMGGFECATHRRRDGARLDVTAATRHDLCCLEDYTLLASAGIRTVRDGLRWHLIETAPGVYDWSSFLPMLRAAHAAGTQVLWDLCHWGVPDDIDLFSDDFSSRFADFAAAAATLIRAENLRAGITAPQIYCPVNEISFWAWVGGDEEHFHPWASERGGELKVQLALASIAATRAVRAVDPDARFIQAEPIIHISLDDEDEGYHPDEEIEVAAHIAGQFEAWDMIAGLRDPELGGAPELLDLIGVNYYWNNQWVHNGDRTPPGHHLHRPLHLLLSALWERYRRPILISETGAEADSACAWLGYVTAELRQAQRLGVPILGLCLYPVMDYPGWDDDRHCYCGLLEASEDWTTRSLRPELAGEIQVQDRMFST